ncbi:MAG: 5-deoxy-glucuronate isomerase, partial [Verrucomicrobia bacterium]|nr:5-deoxy-glucuronate isomerase [Verrucomicrobiota bacterium]
MSQPKPATFVPADAGTFRYVEKSNPQNSNLQFLTYGVYELSGPVQSSPLAHPTEETLLFCWKGEVTATLGAASYVLRNYDVLYVPRGAAYQLGQSAGESRVIICRAPAAKAHP